MRIFDPEIVSYLNKECNGEPVHFVGLGAHDFQLSFGDVERILTTEKAVFSLNGKEYSWIECPTDLPVWLVIGQEPLHFELSTPYALRMCMKSGDFVEFHTAEHQYESTTIDFGIRDGKRLFEVF